MFTWTEHELNDEQGKAILAPGSIFLVACPGSGKTRTLTYKIAYELSRLESDRQFVVAITYTHRAADEIQERIEDLGVDASRLWIGTIHSFCLEWILRPYGIYEPKLANGFRVIDQHEREKLLESLCTPYAALRVTHYDCEYYVTPGGYRIGCQDAAKQEAVKSIIKEYLKTILANRQVDFELILYFAWRLMRDNPVIAVLLSKIFPMLLVDEYQDTKKIQYEILGFILKAGAGDSLLFMVGDPNQAIYGSLGGYAIGIEELRSITGIPIDERELSKNYRSSDRIIRYYSYFRVHGTTIKAAGKNSSYPSLISYDNAIASDDLAPEIARLIRHNVEKLDVSPSNICVLAPQWFHLAAMTRKLAVQMPEYQFDGPGMVPFARDQENFWYKLSRLALTEPTPSLYVRRLRWAGEVIADLRDAGLDVSKLSARTLLRECNTIGINETHGLTYLRSFYEALFDRFGVAIDEFTALREHYDAFFESSEARIARLEAEGLDGVGNVDFFRRVFQNRTGITVSTIHGVKGAEFDVVIAYALLEGMVPHFSDPEKVESAKKLLYVIGSRAKKNLHLFSESGRRRGRGTYAPTELLAAYSYDYDKVK